MTIDRLERGGAELHTPGWIGAGAGGTRRGPRIGEGTAPTREPRRRHDDRLALGRERLMRYGARPPFSLDRLRVLPGGRIAYRIKKLGAGRAKHRVMTPLELLARLAAIVPPPRYPLVRYHGVLAPHSAWRREIVPRPPTGSSVRPCPAAAESKKGLCANTNAPHAGHGGASSGPHGHADRASESTTEPTVSRTTEGALGALALQSLAPRDAGDAGSDTADVTSLAPNILGVRHWSRLLGGLLYATSPRLQWRSS